MGEWQPSAGVPFEEQWVTPAQFASFIGITADSARRYARREGIPMFFGRGRLSDFLNAEKAARDRKGGRGNKGAYWAYSRLREYFAEHDIDATTQRELMNFVKYLQKIEKN